MEISIKRLNKKYHFEASNPSGNTVHVDASPDIGGENKGVRSMELLLTAIGTCSSVDLISILKKQRQELEDIQIIVNAEREKGKIPSLFTFIHLTYHLKGKLEDEKVDKAIKLALEKYCSVTDILKKTCPVTYSFTVNKSV